MSISASKKKQLEALGYTVKGNSVLNKDGGTVAGYNKNGNLFSGSKKVSEILKSEPKAKKPTTRPKARPAKKTEAKKPTRPVARPKPMDPGPSTRPVVRPKSKERPQEANSSGRNKFIQKPVTKQEPAEAPSPSSGRNNPRKPTQRPVTKQEPAQTPSSSGRNRARNPRAMVGETPTVKGVTWEEYKNMTPDQILAKGLATGLTKSTFDTLVKTGYSKGGMVTRTRSGHTDHRKKGMFK